jgi:hypothetical protein
MRCRLLKRLENKQFLVEVRTARRENVRIKVPRLFEVAPSESDDDFHDDFDYAPQRSIARPVPKHLFAHLNWSDEAYAADMQFALRAIAADFPLFQLGDKIPEPTQGDYVVSFKKAMLRMDFDCFDYGISFEPFCTQAFLPSLSAEQHARLMDTAAMRETFRCFFLHLAVELGVHPVALQVILHEAMLRCSPLIVSSPPLLVLKHSFSVAACVPRAMRCTLEIDS